VCSVLQAEGGVVCAYQVKSNTPESKQQLAGYGTATHVDVETAAADRRLALTARHMAQLLIVLFHSNVLTCHFIMLLVTSADGRAAAAA
jgi:hypothetical protein